MQEINIGIPIDLQKLLDTRLLVQAGSGGGKSYCLRKVIESIGNKVQQIVIDPEGEFVTIREKFDFALVSKSGDIPLSLKYAETLAHKLLETNLSAIIDLYELKHHERILFVKRFLDALINAPKELWHPCFVHVDEAHIFCPESSKSESMSAVIDLCTRGRKRGFAGILATQRLSKLHKDAAAECLNKMIGRTGLDIDRKRAGDELGLYTKESMIALRDLQPGEFFAFGPAISNEVRKFKVSAVSTTHLQAGKRLTTTPPTPNAIKKILSKLSDIPEEAERELQTKQQLQAEVTRLRGELTKASKQPVNNKPGEKLTAELETTKNSLSASATKIKELNNTVLSQNKIIQSYQNREAGILKILGKEPAKLPELPKAEPVHISRAPTPAAIKTFTPTPTNGTIVSGAMRMLKAAAMFAPNAITKTRMAAIAGLSHTSGSFSTYKATLKREGLVIENGNEFTITDQGLAKAGDVEPLPSDPQALIDMWCEIIGAQSGAGRMLKILGEKYPQEISQEALGQLAGISHTSGSFSTYRSTLKRNGLIVQSGQMLKAADELFN